MKKYIIIVLSLFLFFTYRAKCQGLEFNSRQQENKWKTSLSILNDASLLSEDSITIAFELGILDYGSFGYVCRLYNSREVNSETLALVFSYDTDERSYLKFNIDSKECVFTDTLCNQNLGSRRWTPVKLSLFLDKDSICFSVNGRTHQSNALKLPDYYVPSIVFGSSEFSEEIPSFAIRNLLISIDNQKISIPLDESIGSFVHDSQGHVQGEAVNPRWLINDSYYWNLLHTHFFQDIAGYNYVPKQDNFICFTSDSLYTLDVQHALLHKSKHQSLPMKMYLGTNFLHPDSNFVYVYEVFTPVEDCSICALDLLTGKTQRIDDKSFFSQRHHHSSFLDTIQNKYYIFGGFGSRKYHNTLDVYDLTNKAWSSIHLKGDFITPRFFSSLGALNSNELLLFGGAGNSVGDQTVGKVYYYDLYKINLNDSTVRKVRDFTYKGPAVVPVRNLLVSGDGNSFYTLCYPEHEADSYLQLYRFNIHDDSYTILGDSIPIESKAILSSANLYYNPELKAFYCCTQEFDENGGESSVVNFYTLSAPAISKGALFSYSGQQSFFSSSFYIVIIIFSVLIIVLAYYLIKRRKKLKMIEENVACEKEVQTERLLNPRENAIYLFGEFSVIDKNGRNITYLFSSKIKQLFLLIFLKRNEGGVTSDCIYGQLWPEKDISSAKNLKGVGINKLRKILDDLDGIELLYSNNHYNIQISKDIYCDYVYYLDIMSKIQQGVIAFREVSNSLIQILSRGKFLQSIDDHVFDPFKSVQEDELDNILVAELGNLYLHACYEQVSQLAEICIKIDPLNETALWYLLNAYHKLRDEELAMKKYYYFVAEYTRTMGNCYPYTFSDILHSDLKAKFQQF